MSLGARIKGGRLELGLKGVDVADRTGLSSGFISQAERGIVSPSVSSLKRIATPLSVPVAYSF